jgi:hypothetical protein
MAEMLAEQAAMAEMRDATNDNAIEPQVETPSRE